MTLAPADVSVLIRARVLLVEDNPASARLAGLVLRTAQAEVSVADTAAEATRLVLAGLRPAIVLLDLELPDLSGLDFVKVLRSVEDTRAIPIVAVTASDVVDHEQAAAAGCDGLIRKPIDVDRFAGEVAAFLRPGGTRRRPTSGPTLATAGHQAAIDLMPTAFGYSRDADLTLIYANRRLEQLFGYRPGELTGASLAELHPAGVAGAAQTRAMLDAVIARGEREVMFEATRVRADRTSILLRVRLVCHEDPELGRLWLIAIDDISRQHDADIDLKRALARSESRFDSLWHAGVIGIAICEIGGTLIEANDRFLALIGRTRDDLAHGRIHRAGFTAPEDLAGDDEASATIRATGIAPPREKHYLRPDGSRIPVLVGGGLLDAGAVVGYAIDLSEKRQRELALRESHRRFDALWRSGLFGVGLAKQDGTIFEANDSYLALIGYSRAELEAGRVRYTELTPPEHLPQIGRAIAQIAAAGVAEPWETETFHKDGRRIPVLVGVAALDDETNLAIVSDLSARKHAEQALRQTEDQLRHAQKMEAVGRLAGGIAHDFNNLLSVIVSYSDLLLADLRAADPMAADLKEILTAANRAADLTRQLLLFSRQQIVEAIVLDAGDVLRAMDRMLRRILGEDIELAVITAEGGARIELAPTHLEQIVVNLAVNARDAMPAGGRLTIETAAVELDEIYQQTHGTARPGRYVMMAVTDSGSGMDRETQRRIFEPFFTTKPIGKGTGLGLSTVFGIVQQADGFIWVYSEVGRGTTFKLYFPRADAEAVQPKQAAAIASLRGSETILVVEDEDQVRKVACGILRRMGYHVIDSGSPGEAILLCEHEPREIHLLLTDVVMPLMSGPELASRVTAMRPDIRVLCMSGYTDDAVARHQVIDRGMAFLQKPLSPEALARRVREVLDAPRSPG